MQQGEVKQFNLQPSWYKNTGLEILPSPFNTKKAK